MILFQLDGRPRYRRKKDWFVFDLGRFWTVIERVAREGLDDCDHQGKTLSRNEHYIQVAKAERCATEDQARMLASNGGTWPVFKHRTRHGIERARTYFDSSRYACVELRVKQMLFEQPVIEWNANILRDQLFLRHGEMVLLELCSNFLPPVTNPDEAVARDEITHLLTAGQLDRMPFKIQREKPPVPPIRRTYVMIDLWEYTELHQRRHQEHRVELCGLHDGDLLSRSACTKTFQAANPLRARELYLFEVLRGKHSLPVGRFLVITKGLFDLAVQHPVLPYVLTRERLVQTLRKRGLPIEDEPLMEEGNDPGGLVHPLEADLALRERIPGEDVAPDQLTADQSDTPPEQLVQFPPVPQQLALYPPSVMDERRPHVYTGPPRPRRWQPSHQLRIPFPKVRRSSVR